MNRMLVLGLVLGSIGGGLVSDALHTWHARIVQVEQAKRVRARLLVYRRKVRELAGEAVVVQL